MVKVNVKWGKSSYDVDVDPAEGIETFQAALFSLTNVPVERQKLMLKGKLVKSNADIAALIDDSKLMLMGSADAAPVGPAKPVVFEEDLTDRDRVQLAPTTALRAGLVNLGNTCYMNSTLQAFRVVPELKHQLVQFANKGGSHAGDVEASVTNELGRLFQELDRTSNPVTPMMFTSVFRNGFAQFAERNSEGQWSQQDADEALQALMQAMANKLGDYQPLPDANKASNTLSDSDGKGQNAIDYIFGGELTTVTRCPESADEPERKTVESFRKLRCHIDAKTSFLSEGLKSDMDSELEMRAASLGRTAVWKKHSAISKLPRYLIVQFVRFDWRKDTQKKAKVLRKVEFPLRLDVSDFCASNLKRSLLAARRTLKDEEDQKLGLASLNRTKNAAAIKAVADKQREKEREEKKANNEIPMDLDGSPLQPVSTTGYYDLAAVVTHKGRYADSGHYIGWTRHSMDSDVWHKFDDDVVTEIKGDDIKALSGGGDWHMAYVLVFKRCDDFIGKTIKDLQPEIAEAAADSQATSSASTSTS